MNTIKNLRIKNEMSQEDLAKILKVTRQTISEWENGTYPSVENLIKLRYIFNCSIDYILLGIDDDIIHYDDVISKEKLSDKKTNYSIGMVNNKFYNVNESSNLYVGESGSGKTNSMINDINNAINRGENLFVYEKSEILPKIIKNAKEKNYNIKHIILDDDIKSDGIDILNFFDNKQLFYSIFSEKNQDPFYQEIEKNELCEIIDKNNIKNLESLYNFLLNSDFEEKEIVFQENIKNNIKQNIDKIKNMLKTLSKDNISAKELCENNKTLIILSHSFKNKYSLEIESLIINQFLKEKNDKLKVTFFIDEFIPLNKEILLNTLKTSRSLKTYININIQTLEILKNYYEEYYYAIISNFHNIIYLGCIDYFTINELSKMTNIKEIALSKNLPVNHALLIDGRENKHYIIKRL